MMGAGSADLPLHYGQVPRWLAERMARLGRVVVESIVMEYGTAGFLRRMSDPFWFQALGCVMGMDWHSSGITTSVMGALKKALNPLSHDLGIYVCGGRGKYSRETPSELRRLGNSTGLDGDELVRCSRLSAKVDNTAVQDGFQLYLHNFIVTRNGEWVVVQQGMNTALRTARRYHWHSAQVKSFVAEPHSAVFGPNLGDIMNLTHRDAGATRDGILSVARSSLSCSTAGLEEISREINRRSCPETDGRHLIMPARHEVQSSDISLKRLGAILALAYEKQPEHFESLLLLEGLGPRTLQSLTLVSEVIHGTPSRFSDPARFSFAHGGKDGHPFPVPVDVYDETIAELEKAISTARLGREETQGAIRKLSELAASLEEDFEPADPGRVDEWIRHERETSYLYGGRTVSGMAQPPVSKAPFPRPSVVKGTAQLSLF
jgi:hypothetical protein